MAYANKWSRKLNDYELTLNSHSHVREIQDRMSDRLIPKHTFKPTYIEELPNVLAQAKMKMNGHKQSQNFTDYDK